MLAALHTDRKPVTHELLDRQGSTAGSRRLRTVLTLHGTLPARDEHLAALERWVTAFLDTITDTHDRRLLDTFTTWHHLRRLRRRHSPTRPLSPNTAAGIRTGLTQSVRLLEWLRHRGVTLSECRQQHIDSWLDQGSVMRFTARGFVQWAARTRHIDNPIDFPPMPCDRPYRALPDDERRRLAHRFLHDDTITTVDRVTGLLVLLYGQPLTKIAHLATDHIHHAPDGIRLALAPTPSPSPHPWTDSSSPSPHARPTPPTTSAGSFPGLGPETRAAPAICAPDSPPTACPPVKDATAP
ncbi:hypothetical protein OG948_33845 [Embleya sp. NBC_00888]|uniref:hypothetical protein n=1 Tax=Embleya sp. NBC_00888 TaxID=2975960 RepID=UPI0038680790|nr:hypothetical protein OG948_33845 [Embleya sp. NBC_00888]